jgi:hypothetical protein
LCKLMKPKGLTADPKSAIMTTVRTRRT